MTLSQHHFSRVFAAERDLISLRLATIFLLIDVERVYQQP